MGQGNDPADPFAVTRDDFISFDISKPPLIFPGVYIFLKKGAPVYIGESADIPRRLREHRRKKWFEEGLETRVLWCADAEVRLIVETIMIFRERPAQNRAIKLGCARGRIYPINFLPAK
jgi:hypothetical protein